MEESSDPVSLVVRFNDCINEQDLDGLATLMTDDHTLVDSEGAIVAGKANCLEAWRGFFEAFPDYRNIFTSLDFDGELVSIEGRSECSDPRLAGPAHWTARTRDEHITEWRVYTS